MFPLCLDIPEENMAILLRMKLYLFFESIQLYLKCFSPSIVLFEKNEFIAACIYSLIKTPQDKKFFKYIKHFYLAIQYIPNINLK